MRTTEPPLDFDSQRTQQLAGLVAEELERAGLAEVYADEIHSIRRLLAS